VSVAGVGVFLGILSLLHLLIDRDELITDTFEILVPLGIALGLVLFGGWLARSRYDPDQVFHIAGWCMGGIVVLALVGGWTVVLMLHESITVDESIALLASDLAVGAGAGALVGLYNVRRQEQFHEAQRTHDALETAQDGIAILDENAAYLTVNQAYADIYGYDDPEAFVGDTWQICYPDEQLDEISSRVMPTLEEQGQWRGELVGERRDGTTFPQEVTLSVRDDGGMICIVRDITDRKEDERELERYETMLNRAGDIVYATDPDGYLTAVNDAATAFLGYAREELVGSHVSLVMDDDDVATGEAIIRELLADDERDQGVFEMDLLTGDGERIPCEDHLQVLVPDGEFRGAVGVVRDITERKEREETLESLHETTRDLFQCETGEEVARQTATAAKSVLGYPINVVRLCSADGTSLRPVAVTDEARGVLGERPIYGVDEGPVGEAFESGRTCVYEDVQQLDDRYDRGDARAGLYLPLGEYGALSINDTMVDAFDQSDVRLAELLATTAATAFDRIAYQEELARQNDRLEDVASVLSHDLRNPLNVAQGRVALLEAETDSEQLAPIRRAHDRMATLIDDVLTLAREGQTVGETTAVDVRHIATRSWHQVETNDATLDVSTDMTIEADASRLQQLFENLFRNAIEHGGDAVSVTVDALDDGTGFCVADDGSGIPTDERDWIFDHGYSTAADGTGFGLAIAEQITQAHGWTITATESAAGGARFEIHDVTPVSANEE
jgi:PAS domain S-box-containing protein